MGSGARHTLSGLLVRQAMRRQLVRLPQETAIDHSINHLIKYKVNALLVTDAQDAPVGVVSKSDIMGAYYAGLPIAAPLAHIMVGPPLYCRSDDALEAALDTMRSNRVYRLYVSDTDDHRIVGALAYPDIVGLLYKYCHTCEFSHRRRQSAISADTIKRFVVGEVMTEGVQSVAATDSLLAVIELLSTYRFGAVLVRDGRGFPSGVISKTDLALAYKHGVDLEAAASSVMSAPVELCRTDALLEDAIKTMIYSDIHRLFVAAADGGASAADVVGVFSLSDAARIRSGSCHACITSRIQLDE
ncbi:MAG: CBS domain-containing protein [Desulfosarcinaceae bacterium]|nr:CBS domain-containing protein [Desulfosarcinaceae bacterium]